ncbi:neuronal cell adhesion molecule-like isoform X2 [Ptychodera flava]|uniref:neuronal cell adhesion molecule-like isoform X2 n=1 Tax=Ptychodera flava TaxID=63121 RepID=UPI003969DB55
MMLCRRYRTLLVISLLLVLSLNFALSQDDQPRISPPSIVEAPKPEEFVDPRSEFAILKCVAIGQPQPTYMWKKNGREVQIDGEIITLVEGTLKIKEPTSRNDEGVYQCFATNNFGTALSHKVSLTIGHLGRFPLSDTTQESFQLYSGAKLECNPPSGAPPPRVFWSQTLPKVLKYSERINQDPDGNLVFSNILESDNGQYFCNVIVDSLGELRQAPVINVTVATLIPAVQRAPVLIYHPDKDVVVLKGQTMKLKCLADAYPTPEISWVRVDAELPADRAGTESFGQTLTIERVEFSDEGSYKCSAANGVAPEAQWLVDVKVEAAPYWEEKPRDKTIPPDSDYTMECNAGGIPPPNIKWLENGGEIPSPDTNPRRNIQGNQIVFTNAKVSDTSVYQCVAENTHGEMMTSLYLNVLSVPAEIREPPPKVSYGVEGKSVSIDCDGFGSPEPTFTWSFGGQALSGGRYEIVWNGTLIISDLTKSDAGQYTCSVENEFGRDDASGKLRIKDKTEIVQPPQDTFVREGERAQFQCSITHDSSLELVVSWERDGVRLETELATSRYTIGDDSSLIISRTQMSDTNDYVCVAQTELDEARASAKLTVQNVPSAPLNVQVDNANDIELDLIWSPSEPNNSPIEAYIIQYATAFTGFSEWKQLTEVAGDQTQTTMNLSPWVTYKFRVIAKNGIGNSAPSEEVGEYSTSPAPPEKNPSKLHGKGDLPSNMIITWEPVPQEDHNGPDFRYNLRYRKQGETDWEDEVISNWQENRFIVENTPTFQAYDISIQSENSEGPSPQPVLTVGFSGEDAPKGVPTDVKVEVVNSTCLEVTWNPIKAEDAQGENIQYKVIYSSEPIKDQRKKRQAEKEEEVFKESPGVLTGLTPYSKYSIQVLAFNNAGEGDPSTPAFVISTPEGTPGPVSDFEVTSLSGGMYLNWGLPESPNGVLIGYIIKYSKFRGTESGTEKEEPISDPFIFRKKIGGLAAEEEYRVSIAARTNAGDGEFTTKSTITRVMGPPLPPSAPDFSLISDSSMNVTWVEDKDSPSVDNFIVQYKQTGVKDADWENSDEIDPLDRSWIILTDLDSGTKYDVRVRAINDMDDVAGPVATTQTTGAGALATDDSFYSEGWFIGLMCVIVFLLIILLIICLIKRNKGGKYHVSEKEDQLHGDIESVPHKDDEGGFGEYKGKESPDTVDPSKKPETGSLTSKGSGDTDSMAEYGDGETGQFNEDGSFIGQYGDEKKRKQQEHAGEGDTSSPNAFSTFV